MADKQTRRGHVVAVGNQKGGVGKTTNTVHLATALGELGRKCLIWDLDMNSGATRHFGIPDDAFLGTFEVLVGEEAPSNVILDASVDDVELPRNVDLIPARRKLEAVDQALSEKGPFFPKHSVLKEPLRELRPRYDYIFLDTAPNATTPTIGAYANADWFLLSAIPEAFALAGINDAVRDLTQARMHFNPDLQLLGVVVGCVDGRTRIAKTLIEHVEKAFFVEEIGSMLFKTTISRATAICRAQAAGKTLFDTEGMHKVADEYRALVREIEERIETFEKKKREAVTATTTAVARSASGSSAPEPSPPTPGPSV